MPNGKKRKPSTPDDSASPGALKLVASAAVGVLAAGIIAVPILSKLSQAPAPAAAEDEEISIDNAGVRQVAFHVDVQSLDELLQLAEPAVVTNLHTSLHQELARHWKPDALRRSGLGHASLSVRLTRGANLTSVMRYSTRTGHANGDITTTPGGVFVDRGLNLEWPRHGYDAWDMTPEQTLEGAILRPPADTLASFSTSIDEMKSVHPEGVAAALNIEKAMCGLWGNGGCPQELDIGRLLWTASAGLGMQLHYDAFSNFFFHLSGTKEVVLVPPAAMIDTAHLFPTRPPASRQSQLRWDRPDSSRRPDGYSTVVGDDDARPAPMYDPSVERRVTLHPGDLLFIPSHWGHQTFTSPSGPTASFALWFYPNRNPRGANPPPSELRGARNDAARREAANAAFRSGVATSEQAWGALRGLGRMLAVEFFGTADGEALLARWYLQRWRPQFGGLGVRVAEMLLPREILCQDAPEVEGVQAAARQLATHLHELTAWSPAAYRDVVVRGEIQDVLDWLVALLPQLRGLDAILQGVGCQNSADMLALLVRSMSECGASQV